MLKINNHYTLKKIILEAFKPGTVPKGESQILRGEAVVSPSPAAGTGVLY